ncbi:hypothetical protein [Streptomyces boninensis]|uniref:hypothetical protein n=1 Tax=Streptomyces boninensis TaxID=2039455 RepID=UPI003B214B1D
MSVRTVAMLPVHGVLAFPAQLTALALASLGGARAGARLQERVEGLLPGSPSGPATPSGPAPSTRATAVAGRAVRALPGAAVAFVLAAPAVGLAVVRGLCYPLAEAGNDVSDSWGGPTMAGAWAVHFAVGVATVAAVTGVLALLRLRRLRGARANGAGLSAS